jgi:RimJ/RimL family protein N-acetyltransferase
MDSKRYFVRPFQEADYEPLARLQSLRVPELLSTAEEEQEWDRTLAASHLIQEKWAVEEREAGKVVGFAALYQVPYGFHPHKFWVSLLVDPSHVSRGIGRALASLLDAEASAHAALSFWTSVRKDDSRSLRFAAQQGFIELRTTWMSVLDLSAANSLSFEDRSDRFEREGIRITTLAQEGPARSEVRHRLYDLWVETGRDVPRMGEFTPLTFDQFEVDLDRPGFNPESVFLAGHGESYIASSHLERDLAEPDTLIVGYTGTRSAYRGRGLAFELKRRTIEYARQHGVRFLKTFNDSLNDPIWRINEKMGFRRTLEFSNQQRDFAPKPPAGGSGTSR